MPLPIKDEINILFTCLPDLVTNWNITTQKLFAYEQEDQKVEALEAALKSLIDLQNKFNSEIDKLANKIQKEITKKKKKTKSINVK